MRSFGELETRIMNVVWSAEGAVTVHEVVDTLDSPKVAYTTAMTVIERLRHKGWLERERRGRAFLYRATRDEGEYAAWLMGEALNEAQDRPAALLSFAEHLSGDEVEALRRALDDAGVDG